jgi:hypothetical protein
MLTAGEDMRTRFSSHNIATESRLIYGYYRIKREMGEMNFYESISNLPVMYSTKIVPLLDWQGRVRHSVRLGADEPVSCE